jgi:hypothetical protein
MPLLTVNKREWICDCRQLYLTQELDLLCMGIEKRQKNAETKIEGGKRQETSFFLNFFGKRLCVVFLNYMTPLLRNVQKRHGNIYIFFKPTYPI